MVASHKTEISQMRGLGRKMPITFICFLIGTLSIIGLPPFGGVWSKWYLALAAAETEHVVFIAVLMISSCTVNFASTLPANSFSGNTSPRNNYGNCIKGGSTRHPVTVTGTCS